MIRIDDTHAGLSPRQTTFPLTPRDMKPENDRISGSPARLAQVLRELAELAGQGGQGDDSAAPPILEILLGDIVTVTSVAGGEDDCCLSVTAMLPRQPGPEAQNPSGFTRHQSLLPETAGDCCWHADEGRHILIRRIPIAELTDDRSVLDAILATADHATALLISLGSYLRH